MGALAMSEATAGSDVVTMKIKADKKGIDFQQFILFILLELPLPILSLPISHTLPATCSPRLPGSWSLHTHGH